VTPEELDRELARLTRLAEAARQRLDELAEHMGAVRSLMDDIAGSGAETAQNPTASGEVAQAEVVSK
jgi:hypothetical protein